MGTWALVTANGAPPPAIIQQTDTLKVQLVADTMIFNETKSVNSRTVFRVTTPKTSYLQNTTDLSTWSHKGSSIILTAPGASGGGFTGTISGNNMTFNFGAGPLVYKRQ